MLCLLFGDSCFESLSPISFFPILTEQTFDYLFRSTHPSTLSVVDMLSASHTSRTTHSLFPPSRLVNATKKKNVNHLFDCCLDPVLILYSLFCRFSLACTVRKLFRQLFFSKLPMKSIDGSIDLQELFLFYFLHFSGFPDFSKFS